MRAFEEKLTNPHFTGQQRAFPVEALEFLVILKASSHTKSKYVNLNQSLYGHYNKLLKVNILGEKKFFQGKFSWENQNQFDVCEAEQVEHPPTIQCPICRAFLSNPQRILILIQSNPPTLLIQSIHHPMYNPYSIHKESLSNPLSNNMSNPPTIQCPYPYPYQASLYKQIKQQHVTTTLVCISYSAY